MSWQYHEICVNFRWVCRGLLLNLTHPQHVEEILMKVPVCSKGTLVYIALWGDVQDRKLKKHQIGKSLFWTRLGLLYVGTLTKYSCSPSHHFLPFCVPSPAAFLFHSGFSRSSWVFDDRWICDWLTILTLELTSSSLLRFLCSYGLCTLLSCHCVLPCGLPFIMFQVWFHSSHVYLPISLSDHLLKRYDSVLSFVSPLCMGFSIVSCRLYAFSNDLLLWHSYPSAPDVLPYHQSEIAINWIFNF